MWTSYIQKSDRNNWCFNNVGITEIRHRSNFFYLDKLPNKKAEACYGFILPCGTVDASGSVTGRNIPGKSFELRS